MPQLYFNLTAGAKPGDTTTTIADKPSVSVPVSAVYGGDSDGRFYLVMKRPVARLYGVPFNDEAGPDDEVTASLPFRQDGTHIQVEYRGLLFRSFSVTTKETASLVDFLKHPRVDPRSAEEARAVLPSVAEVYGSDEARRITESFAAGLLDLATHGLVTAPSDGRFWIPGVDFGFDLEVAAPGLVVMQAFLDHPREMLLVVKATSEGVTSHVEHPDFYEMPTPPSIEEDPDFDKGKFYVNVVWFREHDEVNMAKENFPHLSTEQALRCQLAAEIQEAIDLSDAGPSGIFQTTDVQVGHGSALACKFRASDNEVLPEPEPTV